MKQCSECGTEMKATSKFCPRCGMEQPQSSSVETSETIDQGNLEEILEPIDMQIPEDLFVSFLEEEEEEQDLPEQLMDVTPLSLEDALGQPEESVLPVGQQEVREGNQSFGIVVAILGIGLLVVSVIFLFRGIIGLFI